MPSMLQLDVANGADFILSICDEAVACYETTIFTPVVASTLLFPLATFLDEHLVEELLDLMFYAYLL